MREVTGIDTKNKKITVNSKNSGKYIVIGGNKTSSILDFDPKKPGSGGHQPSIAWPRRNIPITPENTNQYGRKKNPKTMSSVTKEDALVSNALYIPLCDSLMF